ncbi:hypothetical protein ABTE74_19835, partial [Acinetobacter baumannii]
MVQGAAGGFHAEAQGVHQGLTGLLDQATRWQDRKRVVLVWRLSGAVRIRPSQACAARGMLGALPAGLVF